jgi:predicted RNA methylase
MFPATITASLARGEPVSDETFDALMPPAMRALSDDLWTPLEVIAVAAKWIDEAGITSVVDVGSGAGKLCVAGALSCAARFVGIERNLDYVVAARALADTFQVSARVSFVHGELGHDLPAAEAYYFYNPFVGAPADVAVARAFLEAAPSGTYALCYTGYGGRMPDAYTSLRVIYPLPNVLRLWRKT